MRIIIADYANWNITRPSAKQLQELCRFHGIKVGTSIRRKLWYVDKLVSAGVVTKMTGSADWNHYIRNCKFKRACQMKD
jgi:hypothetical protein